MTEITLRVDGMDCGGCVKAVEKAVKSMPGVADAKADLQGASATVSFDPAITSAEEIARTITRAGFKAAA